MHLWLHLMHMHWKIKTKYSMCNKSPQWLPTYCQDRFSTSATALKYVIGLSPYHFGLHQEKKWKSDHRTWGPPNAYFKAYIIHCHGATWFAVGEAKEVLSLQMLGDHDKGMPSI